MHLSTGGWGGGSPASWMMYLIREVVGSVPKYFSSEDHTGKCICCSASIHAYRADVVDIFIFSAGNTILKKMPYAIGTIDFNHF